MNEKLESIGFIKQQIDNQDYWRIKVLDLQSHAMKLCDCELTANMIPAASNYLVELKVKGFWNSEVSGTIIETYTTPSKSTTKLSQSLYYDYMDNHYNWFTESQARIINSVINQ